MTQGLSSAFCADRQPCTSLFTEDKGLSKRHPLWTDEGYWTVTTSTDSDADSDVCNSTLFELSPIPTNTKPVVAVIGVGYVGTHLVESFSSQYDIIAFDISEHRIQEISQKYRGISSVRFTTMPGDISEATHILISVPTLLHRDNTIDTSYLRSALSAVATHARPGSTVVIESSTAVGMTRQLLGPIAAEKHFFAGMSPERVDPGRTDPPTRSIPKIVSGLDDIVPGSLDAVTRLYAPVFDTVVTVSRPEVAEMTKLYENCQRMVCIAYANEMADACIPHGIDPFEVCSVAATKPFGYMPFTPSVGVGGHCIPVNPYYLLSNSSFPLLQAATEKMKHRPIEIAQRILAQLSYEGKEDSPKTAQPKSRVLVVGVGFKRGQSTLSNSPGLDLARALARSGQVHVLFADSLVSQAAVPDILRLRDEDWNRDTLQSFAAIIVAVKQMGLDCSILSTLEGVIIEKWCS